MRVSWQGMPAGKLKLSQELLLIAGIVVKVLKRLAVS